jgi:hypothetical protein
VEGEEPGDSLRSPEVARSHEVRLLDIPHCSRPGRWTGPSRSPAPPTFPPRAAVPGEDPFDGPPTREPSEPALFEFPADGIGAPAGEGGAPCPVGDQLSSDAQDQRLHPGRRSAPDPAWSPAPVPKPRPPLPAIAAPPFGQPCLSSPHGCGDRCKSRPAAQEIDGLATSGILTWLSHCVSSPCMVSGSLRSGALLHDVMAEFYSTILWR